MKLFTQTWHSLATGVGSLSAFLDIILFCNLKQGSIYFNFLYFIFYMSKSEPIISVGWRRVYVDTVEVPVINYPLMARGDMLGVGVDNVGSQQELVERFTIFLDKLYSMTSVRGLNLYNVAYARKGEHANFLLDSGRPVRFVYPPFESREDSPEEWYERNRRVITELETKYLGLFEPIFLKGGRGRSRRGVRSRRKGRGSWRKSCRRKTKKCIRRRRR